VTPETGGAGAGPAHSRACPPQPGEEPAAAPGASDPSTSAPEGTRAEPARSPADDPATSPAPFVERRRPGRGLRTAIFVSILAGIAVLAFGIGLVLFNSLLMPQFIHQGGEVRVPDLANLSEAQAEEALRAAGLRLSHAGERFDPAVPRGLVLQQDPPAQTLVRSGRRVLVVVSLGEEFSSVPTLFGASLRGARILIERAGLTVGGITRAPSEDVGDGLVAGTDPPAESVLPRESPVGLLVSTGSASESFVMPMLLGRDLAMVRRQLEADGFRIVAPEGAGSRGLVILQSPAPGVRVDRSTVIALTGNGRSLP